MAAGAILLLSPGMTRAQTCTGLVAIDYPVGHNFPVPGDIQRVRIELGTGSINGGTQLSIQKLRFELDCNSNFLVLPCTDEGALIEYEGDGTITNSCGKIFTTGHAVSSAPNSIVFTPNTPILIPANQATPPGFCSLEFDVKVLAAPSLDATPNFIEEVGGYTSLDALCDNGLQASGGTQSSAIPLCQAYPPCDDNGTCTTDACNQNTGQCEFTPVADSTPCGDTDQNACTMAGCEQGQCVQTDQRVSCPPTGDCTGGVCNPQTGMCEPANFPDGTQCPDTDQDPCTTAGCMQGQCSQTYANLPDGTTCPDTDQDPCTTPACVQGQCVQNYQTCPSPTPQAITGKKLLLKGSKFVLLSKDPGIAIAGSDPVNGADSSITFNDGSSPVDLALPATLWSANGAGTTFKYKNPDAPGGPSVVKVVKVKSGLLKAVGKGAPIAVPNGPASIDVVFSLDGGTNTYCMTFTGTGDGDKFLVKDASAGTCPGAVCGNNVREDTEACDGSDATACPGNCQANCTCPTTCPATGGDATACLAYTNATGPCRACMDANAPGSFPCPLALGFACSNAKQNDSCSADVNTVGCGSECCPVCGNNIKDGTEQCDGTDTTACPGNCQTDCTCPPVCGNNIREGTEACDGNDATACPGNCQSDCTCPPGCGNNIREGTEACDGTDATACPGNCESDCTCTPCGNTYPSCGGSCPAGGSCVPDTFGGSSCLCSAGACSGGMPYPICGGSCPASYNCVAVPIVNVCFCLA